MAKYLQKSICMASPLLILLAGCSSVPDSKTHRQPTPEEIARESIEQLLCSQQGRPYDREKKIRENGWALAPIEPSGPYAEKRSIICQEPIAKRMHEYLRLHKEYPDKVILEMKEPNGTLTYFPAPTNYPTLSKRELEKCFWDYKKSLEQIKKE